MKTKLTLSVDRDLVQFARQDARKRQRSVSGMFSDYLTARRTQAEAGSATSVNDMVGTLAGYNIQATKANIRKIYAKKHSH